MWTIDKWNLTKLLSTENCQVRLVIPHKVRNLYKTLIHQRISVDNLYRELKKQNNKNIENKELNIKKMNISVKKWHWVVLGEERTLQLRALSASSEVPGCLTIHNSRSRTIWCHTFLYKHWVYTWHTHKYVQSTHTYKIKWVNLFFFLGLFRFLFSWDRGSR